MKLYRVIEEGITDFLNTDSIKGVNTFHYDNDDQYIHFFVLPENAEIYQKLKYENINKKSIVLQCDLPLSLIKDNLGAGMYQWYFLGKRHPFLEVKIKKEDFKDDYIIDSSDKVKDEWKNKEIYNRYLIHGINNLEPITIKSFIPFNVEINPKFNFLHYFPKEDLEKEKIIVDDYPTEIFSDEEVEKIMYPERVKSEKIYKPKTKFLSKIKNLFSRNKEDDLDLEK